MASFITFKNILGFKVNLNIDAIAYFEHADKSVFIHLTNGQHITLTQEEAKTIEPHLKPIAAT